MKRKIKIITATIAIVVAGSASAWYYRGLILAVIYEKVVTKTEYIEIDNLSGKIDEIKKDLLSQLSSCETQGIKEPDGYVKMDSNDFLSWGRYQYQRPTVQLYVKKFYNADINLQRAGLIAWNLDTEIPLDELTLKIIFEDVTEKVGKNGYFEDKGKGWKNWLNCGKKIGIEQQITIIRKLEN